MGIHTVVVGARNASFYKPLADAANEAIYLEEHLGNILHQDRT